MKLNRTGSRWDRNQRININDNWAEIEKESGRLSGIGRDAEKALMEALNVNEEAKRVNKENVSVQQQINTLIAESGTSDAELVQARFDEDGNEYSVLKERLDAELALLKKVRLNAENHLRSNLKEFLKKPPGFMFPLTLHIIKNTFGNFFIRGFDVEHFHPLGKSDGKIYYVSKEGSDQADGLTPETAFRKLDKAFSMPDVDTVYMLPGEYGRQHAYGTSMPNRDIKLKALNGKVTLGVFEDPTPDIEWREHGVGVYKFDRSAVINVYDTKNLNAFGNYSRYEKVNSISNVESQPGTWFMSTDNTLYVHTVDGRKPESDHDIKVVVSGPLLVGGHAENAYYFEGIEFQFGSSPISLDAGKMFLAKDCGFNYAQMSNGLDIDYVDMNITQRCDSYENYADGFNYHANNWTNKYLYFLEVDCNGFRNGFSGATASNNNGSTSHANCIGMRVNGLYFENFGPNVPDVGTRNFVWNIGCTAYDSKHATGGIDFLTENEMWLDSCVAYNSQTSLYTQVEGAKIHVRNTDYFGSTFVKTEGNLIEY